MRVPQDRAHVVVPLGVERGAQQPVVVGVDLAAVAAVGVGLVVDGAEAGGGEGGEHARVRGDAGGDGLASAQSGGDELVGVVAVDGRAGGAAGGAAVAAADQQFARREPAGIEVVENLAGRTVQTGAVPGEADRVRASTESGYLPCEGRELAGCGELRQLGGEPGAALQRRPPCRRGGDVCRAGLRGERRRRERGGWNGRGGTGVGAVRACGRGPFGGSAEAVRRGAAWAGRSDRLTGNGGALGVGRGGQTRGLVGGARW